MQRVSVVLMTLAILACGLSKRERYRSEVRALKDYALCLEQLKQCVCFEKIPLPMALQQVQMDKCHTVKIYLQQLRSGLMGGKVHPPEAPFDRIRLPLEALSSPAQTQERILTALIEDVHAERREQEQKLAERCRSCMSVSAALAAICAVVLL